ncbi:MAG: ATP-dependent DNA helicase RecG [Pseudomonadota bacterium]
MDQPVTSLRGVGAKVAERLGRLGLERVQDLLFHLPLRYEDRTCAIPVGSLRAGHAVLIVADVQVSEVKFGRRRSLLVRVADGTGHIDLRFFHFGNAQKQGFKRGARVQCFGDVRRGPAGLEMVHPEYQLLGEDEPAHTDAELTAVYPTTEGLNQATIRRLCQQALAGAERSGALEELLPQAWRQPLNPASSPPDSEPLELAAALSRLHAPPAPVDRLALEQARQRLGFEEMVAHQLSHRALRAQATERRAKPLRGNGTLEPAFVRALGFELTGAQRRVVDEIGADLVRGHPMYRLVQGDVGSGKTVVAALAAIRAVESGHQCAVMAPTELLAEQHLRQFSTWFEPHGVRVAWLGGKQTARARRDTLEALASGQCGIAVGTHALFQEAVRFARLGLVIIDEQHRFGVHQRHALLAKGGEDGSMFPHQLIMTATPIPRTLAMTAYAHLDVSAVDELPPGRQQIDTAVLPDSRRPAIVQRIAAACAAGQQAYWVCPLIEESEAVQAEAAQATAQALAQALPQLQIGLVHGRLKPAERDLVMQAFRAGDLDLLVATTVIEVGVDVPNASLMIIENAERLGLSQLHQLRGRVGRGQRKSACVLVYKAPLSRLAKARLGVLRDSTDGFEIAEKDLELRGPGEVLGTRQTGDVQMRVADLGRDHQLLEQAVEAAEDIVGTCPHRAPLLIQRWIGRGVEYAEVG